MERDAGNFFLTQEAVGASDEGRPDGSIAGKLCDLSHCSRTATRPEGVRLKAPSGGTFGWQWFVYVTALPKRYCLGNQARS